MTSPRLPPALTRAVGDEFADGQRTFVERTPIDLEEARHQHAAYVAGLESLGYAVRVLPALPHLPDAPFVEDPVVVLDDCAVLMTMGVETRRREVPAIASAVEAYRPLLRLERPGRMEGGDVLRIGRDLYVGLSARTDARGVTQLQSLLEPRGYRVIPVEVEGCLHLKTACTWAGRHLLINPEWVDQAAFAHLPRLPVPAGEPWSANVIARNGRVLVSSSHPGMEAVLQAHDYGTSALEISEFEKAEAGLTCLSVRFNALGVGPPSPLGPPLRGGARGGTDPTTLRAMPSVVGGARCSYGYALAPPPGGWTRGAAIMAA